MNLLTVPRKVVGLEYKALRYPAQVLEVKIIAAKLPEESAFRLGFERLLGGLDSAAGALLADPALVERGRLLTRRTEIVAKAATLESKAAQRREQADTELKNRIAQAGKDKKQAQAERDDQERRIAAAKTAEKQAVDRAARERRQAEQDEAKAKADADVAAERDRLAAKRSQIDEVASARTKGAKQQLTDAARDKQSAHQRKSEADTLAALAQAEKASRRS